jgi:hypothetical protein
MTKLPLLTLIVVGVALWAAPSRAQESWYPEYVADRTAVEEGLTAIPAGGRLCPPNTLNCTKPSAAYFHIPSGTAIDGTEDSNVLNVGSCNLINVCLTTTDDDGTTAGVFITQVVNDAKAIPRAVLVDVDGDGVIQDLDDTDDAGDYVPLDGDDGRDNDGDGTRRQTSCIYDIGHLERFFLDVVADGGDDSYVEVTCR